MEILEAAALGFVAVVIQTVLNVRIQDKDCQDSELSGFRIVRIVRIQESGLSGFRTVRIQDCQDSEFRIQDCLDSELSGFRIVGNQTVRIQESGL